MKDEALTLVRELNDPVAQLNLLREYMQAFILRSLHESEAFLCLSFVGGTALRFLYALPRFSEDLDFSLENTRGYEPVKWMKKLKHDLSLAQFESTLIWNNRKTVHTAWINTAEILHTLHMAAMPEQKLSIKIGIDTKPPHGAAYEKRVVNRHMIFALRHHDLTSLMAGKIHALITRKYTKGRDWHDLLWYRTQRPPVTPNLLLLQDALNQTQGNRVFDASHWKQLIRERLDRLEEKKLIADVQPFLERPQDSTLLTKAHLQDILG